MFYPYRIPVPIAKEAEWTPEPTCLVPEKRKSLTAAKIQTPNHSAHRTSLWWLCYLGYTHSTDNISQTLQWLEYITLVMVILTCQVHIQCKPHTWTQMVRQFNSQNSRSLLLGYCVRQTRVLKHVWTSSNLRLHEPQTKWVVRSREAEEVVRVCGIWLVEKWVKRIWSSG